MEILVRTLSELKHLFSQETHQLSMEIVKLSRYESYFYRKFGMQFAYGHREILLRAMDLDFSHAFPVVLQHGVYTPMGRIQKGVALPPRKTFKDRFRFISFSQTDADHAKSYGVKDVVAIGSPWLYVPEKERAVIKDSIGFFPVHHHATKDYPGSSLNDIFKRIGLVRNRFPGMKLTVFLYFSEFLRPEWHEASIAEDFELFCAGLPLGNPIFTSHTSRVDFYKNLKRKLMTMEVCAFESYTSAIFYAGSLNKPAAITKSFMTDFRIKEDPFEEVLLDEVLRLSKFDNFIESIELRDFSLLCLGQEELKSSKELFSILEPMSLESLKQIYMD